jgi:hypothetical protein
VRQATVLKRVTFGAALALSFVASTAGAQSLPIDLEWVVPGGCPARERVLEDIGKMAHPAPGQPRVRARTFIIERGSIDSSGRASTEFVAELTVGDGFRMLHADRCEAAADAVAFILALALDPAAKPLTSTAAATAMSAAPGPTDAGVPAPAPAPAPGAATNARDSAKPPDPTAGTPPAPSAPPSAAPETPPRPWPDRNLSVLAGAGGDLATMPKPTIGPFLALGIRAAMFRIEAHGVLLPQQTTSVVSDGNTFGARISGFAAGARAAYRATLGPLDAGPMLGLTYHRLSASAFGATQSGSNDGDWVSGALGGFLAVPFADWIALRLDAAADFAFGRPNFVIENVGSVHTPATLSGCAGLGLEVRFF